MWGSRKGRKVGGSQCDLVQLHPHSKDGEKEQWRVEVSCSGAPSSLHQGVDPLPHFPVPGAFLNPSFSVNMPGPVRTSLLPLDVFESLEAATKLKRAETDLPHV